MKKTVMCEIANVENAQLFHLYHESKGHTIREHLLTDFELRQKLYEMPRPMDIDDIVMATRFFDEEQARKLIQIALLRKMDAIVEWRSSLSTSDEFVVNMEYEEITGEGICKNASWKEKIPVHGIRIILVKEDRPGRAFFIKTAYPIRTIDDNDLAYEAIDVWMENKKRPVAV